MEHQNNVRNLLKVNNKFNNCSLWTSKSWLGAWVHFNTWRYYEQLIEYNILHIVLISSFEQAIGCVTMVFVLTLNKSSDAFFYYQ